MVTRIPMETPDFLQVMYHGNLNDPTKAHIEVRARIPLETAPEGHRGGAYNFFDEGYKAAMRADRPFDGRQIGLQHLRIIVSEHKLTVWENEKMICEENFDQLARLNAPLPWLNGYLYLVQAGHNDRPARDVFFSNIHIHQLPTQQSQVMGRACAKRRLAHALPNFRYRRNCGSHA